MAKTIDLQEMYTECTPLARELDDFLATKDVPLDRTLAAMGRLLGSRVRSMNDLPPSVQVEKMQNLLNILCTFANLEMANVLTATGDARQ